MLRNKKILIVSTRLNSVWTSMQEIIPSLEKLWGTLADQDHQVILCEKLNLKTDLALFVEADVIIVAAFNASVAKTLCLIRGTLSIDTPWIFYLHNQATIGLWPLYHWTMGELLTTSDEFVSTCSRDAECFNQLFLNKKANVIPFHYFPLEENSEDLSAYDVSSQDFVFVGRISSQKNLHTLLLSYGLLNNKKTKLHFFGQEDGLGSPNMGTKDTQYQRDLLSLCDTLGITSRVHFHGFVKREVIESLLTKQHPIFISPSLHSDENFGMAAMRALHDNCRCVLSDWGGHFDFKQAYTNQVELVKVYQSADGPFLDPSELTEAMEKSLSAKTIASSGTNDYQFKNVQALAQNLIATICLKDQSKLIKTSLLEETLKRVTKFHNPPTGKIFESYQDKLSHPYFSAYGARENHTSLKKTSLLPWVEKIDSRFKVIDPHRGEFFIENEDDLRRSGYLY